MPVDSASSTATDDSNTTLRTLGEGDQNISAASATTDAMPLGDKSGGDILDSSETPLDTITVVGAPSSQSVAHTPPQCPQRLPNGAAATSSPYSPTSPKAPKSPTKAGGKLVYNRKADRAKILARNIGFQPSEPCVLIPYSRAIEMFLAKLHFSFCRDLFSTQDKRRLYMNSLEEYVLYLHQQLRLVGQEPLPIPQLHEYKGLNTRSLRVRLQLVFFYCDLPLTYLLQTMLVHMESTARKVNNQVTEDERKVRLTYNHPLLRSPTSFFS
jgi:hypothetical protein